MGFGAEESKSDESLTSHLILQSQELKQFKISLGAARLSRIINDVKEESGEGSAVEESEAISLANPNLTSNALL